MGLLHWELNVLVMGSLGKSQLFICFDAHLLSAFYMLKRHCARCEKCKTKLDAIPVFRELIVHLYMMNHSKDKI